MGQAEFGLGEDQRCPVRFLHYCFGALAGRPMVAVGFIPRTECRRFMRHVRDDVKYADIFRGINSPATFNRSLCDVSLSGGQPLA